MRRLVAFVAIIGPLAIAAVVVAASYLESHIPDCAMRPLSRGGLASISGGMLPARLVAVGACPERVEYAGREYVQLILSPAPGLTDADVERIGEATAAYSHGTVGDPSVYAVDGVDPATLIAMRRGPPNEPYLLFADPRRPGAAIPEALCRHFASAAEAAEAGCVAAGSGRPVPTR